MNPFKSKGVGLIESEEMRAREEVRAKVQKMQVDELMKMPRSARRRFGKRFGVKILGSMKPFVNN